MREKQVIVLNVPGFDSGSLFKNRIDVIEVNKQERKEKQYTSLITTPAQKKEQKKEEKKKRGRKPGKSKMYFTQETEDNIVKYNQEKNTFIKNDIYNNHLKVAVEKLAENIINTFSFSYIQDPYEVIKAEVVSHMILNMDKYKQDQGKAFSYFSIMCKNYLIIKNNEQYAHLKTSYSIDSNESSDYFEFDIVDASQERMSSVGESKEFIRLMIDYWDVNIASTFKKKRDMDIAIAVVELFRNVGSLEFFNKKALYLLIREMTGHKTQYITHVINKMQSKYSNIKKSYNNHGYIKKDDFFKKHK
jgi:anti-sigma28 factor (negative regulator of flagellin synthesis)